MSQIGERQKVGGRVLATIGRTPRRTTRRFNRLKGSIADLLQPAILRPPTFWRSPNSFAARSLQLRSNNGKRSGSCSCLGQQSSTSRESET